LLRGLVQLAFRLDAEERSTHHRAVVKVSEIRRFVSAIAREFKPERVVLFGSYARGEATEDSDVDLLVVMQHDGDAVEQALEIRRRIDRAFPLDLIVKGPQETRKRLRQNDAFVSSIFEAGKILYERPRQTVV
jgi:predicted nucleotidyltransferase